MCIPERLRAMFREAVIARNNAYAPYSKHPVGVAIRTADGKIYTGANVEAAHFKSICAEASAISSMITSGSSNIVEVVIAGPHSDFCFPCGDCRQRISEFGNDGTMIYSFDGDGHDVRELSMRELLPYAFTKDNMKG